MSTRRSWWQICATVLAGMLATGCGAGTSDELLGAIEGDALEQSSTQLVPAAGATCAIEGTNHNAIADDQGHFVFVGIAGGEYVLICSLETSTLISSGLITVRVTEGETTHVGELVLAPVDMESASTLATRRYDAGLVSGSSTFNHETFLPLLPLKTAGFAADSSGGFVDAPAGIAKTQFDGLYQTETWIGELNSTTNNWATFTFADLPNGEYTVHLHFADWVSTNVDSAGDRLFHVDLQGERRLTNYDIFAESGGKNTAVRESLDVEVTNGTLVMNFTNVVFNAAVAGVEVLPRGVAPLALDSSTLTTCTPLTCADIAHACGEFDNGCNTGTIQCSDDCNIPTTLHTEGDSGMEGAYGHDLHRVIATTTGREVTNTAKGGSSFKEIKTRILAASALKANTIIINDMANNGYTTLDDYIADARAIVAYLGHDRFVFIASITPPKTSDTGCNSIAVTNEMKAALIAEFGAVHVLDVIPALQALSNGTSTDINDVNCGTFPRSLLVDTVHMTQAGIDAQAALIPAAIAAVE